jgi:hypothetical protein
LQICSYELILLTLIELVGFDLIANLGIKGAEETKRVGDESRLNSRL